MSSANRALLNLPANIRLIVRPEHRSQGAVFCFRVKMGHGYSKIAIYCFPLSLLGGIDSRNTLPDNDMSRSNHTLFTRYRFVLFMNKMDLIDRVHQTVGGTKADADRAVEAIIDAITNSLKAGEEVSVAGLGIFEAKIRAARTGRNPRTGESISVPSMRVPKFRASKTLKDAVKS